VQFRILDRMTMPSATQLIASKNPLAVVDENEIGGIEAIVAIDLDKQIR
jgi:hypothetical protein